MARSTIGPRSSCVADTSDVQAALLVAHRHGIPVSVRGGGHDWAGRAIRDGGLVIDLSAMRSVRIDPVNAVAEVQGGALAADVLDAAAPYGLATAAGAVRGVGMVGMSMAGGYGGLIGRFGLALDNVISAEVVPADGSTVLAGPDGDPELLWALRGGGGNFGVVTSARFRLHQLGPVLGGMVMYPFDQARQVLRGYHEVISAAPDELTVMAGFLTGPERRPGGVRRPDLERRSGRRRGRGRALDPAWHTADDWNQPDAVPRPAADVRGRISGRQPVRARHPLADGADRRRSHRPR